MSGEQIREGYSPPRYEDEEYPTVRAAPDFENERRHLFLLSIFYYIMAVLFALGGCGLTVLIATNLRDRYPRELIALLIYGTMFFTLAFSGGVAGALVVAGRFLAIGQRYVFCLVMSIVLLFSGPVGIPLGAWTLIVLLRRSIQDLFDRGSDVLHLTDGRITPSFAAGDKRCLRILSLCYIAAAIGLIVVGLWFTAGAIIASWNTFYGDFGPSRLGGPSQSDLALLACIAATCAGIIWVLIACLIRTARSLPRSANYTFCIVMATIICILPPLGTALGVATLLMLTSDSVKDLFDRGPETH